jgi:putative membrane protein
MHGTTLVIFEIFAGIAFLGILAAVITVVMTRWTGKDWAELGAAAKGGTAEEILRQRYARGELTREQYQQMRQDLGPGAAAEAERPATASRAGAPSSSP